MITTKNVFKFLNENDLDDLPKLSYRVDGLIADNSLTFLIGQPGTFKSFLALDIALSVASGSTFAGRAAVPGGVVYVAGERQSGLSQRATAWRQSHNARGASTVLYGVRMPDLASRKEVDAFTGALGDLGTRVNLLVLDTLARGVVGVDENSAREMGMVLANIDRLRAAVGCAILVIHHTKKDGVVERGSGSIRGAADLLLAVSMRGRERVSVSYEKGNDIPPFDSLQFAVRQVAHSVVLEYTGSDAQATIVKGAQLNLLQALQRSASETGVARHSKWLEESQSTKATFNRHFPSLIEAGLVVTGAKGEYNLTEAGTAVIATARAA